MPKKTARTLTPVNEMQHRIEMLQYTFDRLLIAYAIDNSLDFRHEAGNIHTDLIYMRLLAGAKE